MLPDGKMYALYSRPQNKSGFKPLPVVIIGNGPSGICLSYLLSGYIPYFKRDSIHPHPILQKKLKEAQDISILDQDLEYLSEGLEGRSHSPVALLFDTLQRPDTDFGGTAESVLTWWHETGRAIPHVVLGRNAPGGAWHSIEGSMVTLSRGEWMGLPDLPFKDWLKQKKRGLRNNRATAEDIAQYYQHYVVKKGLQKNFRCNTVVTSVRKVSADSISSYTQDWQENSDDLVWNFNEKSTEVFQVDGFFKTMKGDKEPFSIYAENVVLATGTYDSPTWLGVKGENLSYVHHQLSALEEAVKNNSIGIMSDPVLIVGAGLTAADAILFAHHSNIPIIHVFRRKVSDPGLIFNQLPKMMYPEYHKVHQMMKEQSAACVGPYECYVSLPEHHVLSFGKDKKCIFQDKNGHQKVYKISMALVLTGSNPNLSFLPNNGVDLAMNSSQSVNPKRNPINVDPFTYESTQEKGLYALGPLAGDNFVRFVQGGALAVASSLLKKANENPP
ncbi:oxidative stress-induced growth inhibitor 1 [Melopsittacus undulatus]|uniref:Oxidative stress-induced growth inhibitor 1 n=1 Tax=Melopsittacus undulatus TaxID=13146 RepID=A0A8C6JY76_MELUD|nr:oxidative stress-induced growth inhibitor 1 [Melopsittacus undulatus]XP_030907850.1 oxidative stress-induced growth inhibitor 1 [Melopsittacus undulatus]XP_030907851.1 oxidative stress-induced growth inhibitor 1 [Melopsittacus undulatus]